MKRNYVIDTNVFLENHEAITLLRNHEENAVFVPKRVLLELDGLKNCVKVGHLAKRAIFEIEKNINFIEFIGEDIKDNSDLKILNDIKKSEIENPILVTNDRIFRLFAQKNGVISEEFKESLPFKSESEIQTGFLKDVNNNPEGIKNFFSWEYVEEYQKSLPVFYKHGKDPKPIHYINEIWKVKPKFDNIKNEYDFHQNCAMELLLDEDIKIVSIQSQSGSGKSYLSLAAALENVLNRKRYKKILLFKPIVEAGESIGLLPGTISDKTSPYMEYIFSLMEKLSQNREFKRLYKKGTNEFDNKMFNFVPVSFIRGMDIENSIVLVDECQNYSRDSIRTIMTRCGAGTKIILTGDSNQVDNNRLNPLNNGLNWVVKCMKSSPIYAHITLSNKNTRGPICDEVLRCEL